MKIKPFSIAFQTAFFIILICLLLISLGVWQAVNARSLRLMEARDKTSNLARALSKHAEDACKVADTLLLGLVERLEVDGTQPEQLERMHKLIISYNAELPMLQRLTALDEHGHWLVTSQQTMTANVDNSDREYFIFHRDHTDRGPHIGPPIHAKSTGAWIIPISRRVNHADGSFAGVVLASLDLNYFQQFYNRFDIGKDGAMTLIQDNGTLLVRRPFVDKFVGKNVSNTVLFRDFLPKSPEGTLQNKSTLDGFERIVGYARVEKFPLVAVAALSEDEELAEWRSDCYRHFTVIMILVLLILLLGYRLVKQIVLRSQGEIKLIVAQDELKALNLELEKLSQQDGLTGLYNRRQFDVMLKNEFNRAIRYSHSLAVMMIDVDRFKQYNDMYGHPAGDECLRTVAKTLQSIIKRPADVSARYGGEEFIMLLQDANIRDADKVAEHIRQAVQDLKIEHAGSSFGIVTISCGVSAIVPEKEGADTPLSLIQAADQALYAAKSGGRNRVWYEGKPE